jgi:hypothetical protein
MNRAWPDGTPKSTGNAFDWRNTQSVLTDDKEWQHAVRTKAGMAKPGKIPSFTIYSRAKPGNKA